MAEVLTQKQIDELLGSLTKGSNDFKEIEELPIAKKIKDYDFLSPKKFTKEHLKLLDSVFENFSRIFSLHLTSMLRTTCQMEIIQIEEEEYREFNNALSDSVLVGVVDLRSAEYDAEEKQILVEMARPVSFSIMDHLLGGSGEGYIVERNYTDIEMSLLEYVFRQIATLLKSAWGNYLEIDHSLNMIETNSRLLQMIQPDESVAIVVVEVSLKHLKGNMNICLPASSLEGIFKAFATKYSRTPKKGDVELEAQRKDFIMRNLKNSPLTVSAMLGQTSVSLQDMLNLQAGDVIMLNTKADEPAVTLQVEGVPWFTGNLGSRQKKYAVKIEETITRDGR